MFSGLMPTDTCGLPENLTSEGFSGEKIRDHEMLSIMVEQILVYFNFFRSYRECDKSFPCDFKLCYLNRSRISAQKMYSSGNCLWLSINSWC